MNNFLLILSEIIAGKSLFRISLQVALQRLFKQEPWLTKSWQVLEIGAEEASHHRRLPSSWRIERSNYVPIPGVAHVFDANAAFPFSDGKFQGVALFNVLPVLELDSSALDESVRCATSFVLFNAVHVGPYAPHPKDFNRYTRDRLERMLNSIHGARIVILPVGGTLCCVVSLLDLLIKWRLIRAFLYPFAWYADRWSSRTPDRCPLQHLCLVDLRGRHTDSIEP